MFPGHSQILSCSCGDKIWEWPGDKIWEWPGDKIWEWPGDENSLEAPILKSNIDYNSFPGLPTVQFFYHLQYAKTEAEGLVHFIT